MPLILHGLPPLHWALAGVGIAGVTLALLFLANRRLGISTGFEDICSLALPAPYFQARGGHVRPGVAAPAAGGSRARRVSLGRPWRRLGTDVGARSLRSAIGLGPAGKLAWMFVGGLFIGFGTRLAGGCTSGHGIFGLANLEFPSLISTVSFMAAGIVTTQFVYRVLFPLVGL